nr:protein root hair defective 3 [Tanacetum cinerariifolium]
MEGLKRIANLNLEENKSKLLKNSIFGDLLKITNPKESSALLLTPLYQSYDVNKGVFVFNDEASFSFCSKEIADATGMRDSGISLKEYEEGLSSSPHFPQYVFELRGELVNGAEGKIMPNHIRTMLMKMSVDDDEKKLIFKRLMIYYLFEEVLLSEANSNRAVIYKRIGKIRPKLSDKKSHESPPIQMYKGQRVKDLHLILKALKASDIDECTHYVIDSEPEAPPTHNDEANDDASNDGDEARATDGSQPNPPDVASEAGLRRSTRDKRKILPFSPGDQKTKTWAVTERGRGRA